MASLLERDGAHVIREIPITEGGVLTFGRSPANSVIVDDPGSSRKHCVIKVHGGEVRIIDMGSANGTRVNGERVRERVLAQGDVVRIGKTDFHFLS